jgi:hypothetical protein
MTFVAHAHGHVADRVSGIQDHGQNLPLFHRFKLEFRFDEIVRADDPTQIQFSVRSNRLLLLVHEISKAQRLARTFLYNKKGQPFGLPLPQFRLSVVSTADP